MTIEGRDRIWALRDGARNLGGDVKPYRYRMLGHVATLGQCKGIAGVLGLRFRGFLGWFVTRTLGGLGRPRGLRDG